MSDQKKTYKYLNDIGELEIISNKFSILVFSEIRCIQFLYMSNLGLKDLPDEIYDLTQLKVLCPSENNISHISDKISRLVRLESLDIGYNTLSTLPREIG